jgi:hypothetical protein
MISVKPDKNVVVPKYDLLSEGCDPTMCNTSYKPTTTSTMLLIFVAIFAGISIVIRIMYWWIGK